MIKDSKTISVEPINARWIGVVSEDETCRKMGLNLLKS